MSSGGIKARANAGKTVVSGLNDPTIWGLGATWDATARTSGRIQYGNQKRKFADPTKEATLWGDDADPDDDGLSNYFEHLLAGNPNLDSTHLLPETETRTIEIDGQPGGERRQRHVDHDSFR